MRKVLVKKQSWIKASDDLKNLGDKYEQNLI